MKKIIFLANVDSGKGMSGGTRIYIELLKNWGDKFDVIFLGSKNTITQIKQEGIKKAIFVETSKTDNPNLYSLFGVFLHFLKRFAGGIKAVKKNLFMIKQADFIYSTSDFYPDFLPALYLKLKNPKIQWIVGYYLFAPNPFSRNSPYRGKHRLRGFLYWLMQRPTYFLAKKYADFVFITSKPDVKEFITRKRGAERIIVVQGGVDITKSEKYLKSNNVIPFNNRNYDACFIGRFHYQKGVVELVDIWKNVCEIKKGARLAMIGNGSLQNPIEKMVREKIKKYGLENNIDLLGFKDGQEKYEIFKQSKIIVHPATYDSGGMAAAEGMAWKLPGVSFDLEALKTYYPKGMLKTEISNKRKFSENILKLLSNKELYEKKADEAHDLIIETWDWQKKAELIYNKLFSHE